MDNKLKILNYLGKNIGKSFTMHELSKKTNVPYATFYRTILKMNDLVKIQKVGRANTIALNANNAAIKSYLVISSEEEKKDFLKKQPMIKKIVSELNTKDAILLFGSYAKRSERKISDIDLMIINQSGGKSLSFSKYELLFKKKINAIFFTKTEFIKMLNETDENVGKQALKWHVVLNNAESFWGCVLHGQL